MHNPSLWRVLAILWHHGTFGEQTLSSLDILGTGISEDLFQVYQGNANCCARNHRSADGHHLECDKHRVSETLAGMYGMMLVQGMRLRGSSLYNEDDQSFLEPRHVGMFQHFLFGVFVLQCTTYLLNVIDVLKDFRNWTTGCVNLGIKTRMLPEYFLLGCVPQRSFAKCWSSSERACFQQRFSAVAFKRCTSTWKRRARRPLLRFKSTWLDTSNTLEKPCRNEQPRTNHKLRIPTRRIQTFW